MQAEQEEDEEQWNLLEVKKRQGKADQGASGTNLQLHLWQQTRIGAARGIHSVNVCGAQGWQQGQEDR